MYENPIPRARRAFPFIAVLQSDFADTGRDRMVAPLVPRTRMPGAAGRLTPVVSILGVEHLLLVPRMTAVPVADLREPKDEIARYRDAITAAIDFLFLGV